MSNQFGGQPMPRGVCSASAGEVQAALQNAVALHQRGQLVEAEQIYRTILQVAPDHFDATRLLGFVLLQRRNFVEGEQLIAQALKINPNDPSALNNRGSALQELKRFDEALASYDKAIGVKPDYAAAFYNRGNVLRELRRFDEALASYDKAITLWPNHAETCNARGIALKELKRFDEALASFDKAIALKPDYADAYNNQGLVRKELKRFDEALASYDKAITVKPDYAEAFNNRGNALQELERFEAALASYDKATAVAPDYADAFNNRGVALTKLKRFDEALASFDRAIALKGDDAKSFDHRANALGELKRFDEALASYDKAIALKPDYAEAFCNRGITLQALKRFDEALANFDKAIALKPGYAEAFNRRAFQLIDFGRLAEARQAAEQAIQLAPRKPAYYRTLGNTRRHVAGDPYLAAMEQLARDPRSLSIDDRIELHFALVKAYEDLDHSEKAFQQMLTGNALKRRQIRYDEAAVLGMLNRIQQVFTTEVLRTRQNVAEPSRVPIFIIGMPRSGTTLVEQVLASHPQVFGAGELKDFGKSVAVMEMGSQAFPNLVLTMTNTQFCQLGARYLAEIKRLAPHAARIVDKMPSNYIYAGLIHLTLPNAAIIHTQRDPIDTCVSCFTKLFTEGQEYSYDLAELGRYYQRYQALMAHWHRVLPPDRILNVRYEDVVDDLEGQARRIIAHCGLDWDERCLQFYETERPVQTASATQVRQPIYNSSVDRWRAYSEFLTPLMVELGVDTSLKA